MDIGKSSPNPRSKNVGVNFWGLPKHLTETDKANDLNLPLHSGEKWIINSK